MTTSSPKTRAPSATKSPAKSPAKSQETPFRSGFVAITGQPNTGKSTFLNAVMGRKIAIVTPKAQTTRTRILGVCHRPQSQMVLLDTPGIHRPGASLFNKAMVQTAYQSCQGVDAVLYFIDGLRGLTEEDQAILSRLPHGHAPLFLILNKVDRLDTTKLFARLHALQEITCTAVVPLSALTGYNIEHLLTLVATHLPEGPRYFPADQWTDQPEEFFAAEIIREKLFLYLQKELPYSVAVKLGRFQERPAPEQTQPPKKNQPEPPSPPIWDLAATILVERDSQKGIVIGHQGSMLKKVGSAARLELERLFGVKIFLQLLVQVRKDWSENVTLLQDLGYPAQ